MEEEGDYPVFIHMQGGITCLYGVVAVVISVGFIIILKAITTLFAKINNTEQSFQTRSFDG